MKKEFSFYEFTGIIVPSTIFLYAVKFIVELVYKKHFFDFDKIGETAVFVVICYGFGHILQSVGNIFESFLWYVYKGMPTEWLINQNRFGKTLFETPLNQKIADKVQQKFGVGITDYGGLVSNYIFQKNITARIDIFNGNYSLFRGLSVSFFLIALMCAYYFSWTITLISIIPFVLSLLRMIKFAKYYATEVFKTFYNLPE